MEDTEYKFDDIHVEVLIEKTLDMYNGNDLFCVLVNGDWNVYPDMFCVARGRDGELLVAEESHKYVYLRLLRRRPRR